MVLFLSLLSLVYMLCSVVVTVISFIRTDRQGRCRLLKNYKKGKFATIFVAVFPLYLAAYYYAGNTFFRVFLNSFNSTIRIVALSFDFDALDPIKGDNLLFEIALQICIAFAVLNAIVFSASLFFRRLFNGRMLSRIRRQRRDVCVLVGTGANRDAVLSSLRKERKKTDVLVLSSAITDDFKEKMYVEKAAYLPFSSAGDLSSVLTKVCGGFDKRHVSVILLAEEEEENLRLAFSAAKLARELGEELCLVSDSPIGFDVYLFSRGGKESVYRNISRLSYGTVHCMNRYSMLAGDFVMRYPITEFIPDLIDTEHATLKEGADIRVSMIGFGNANHQLFRVLAQNSQCMTMKDGVPREKPISYYIFDKTKSYEEASFNHTYLHYRRWKGALEDCEDYFELPDEPADVHFEELDTNKREFLEKFRGALTTSKLGFNIVIVAMGEDIEALDTAQKLAINAKEAGCEERTKIFVRIRSRALSEEISEMSWGSAQIIPFGDEQSLFTYDRIVNSAVESMAKDRHLCYSAEWRGENETEEDIRRNALRKWYFEWESVQRDSNIYAVLAIRMRLQLLGYDIAPITDDAPDATADFYKDYSRGNDIVYDGRVINGKKMVDYKTDYRRAGTPRSVLAQTEHSRWNAYYIGAGFVPASKSEWSTLGKSEMIRARKHINIATFAGIEDYERWCSTPDDRTDIVFYDYQIMDDVSWLLSRNGYKIVKRQSVSHT